MTFEWYQNIPLIFKILIVVAVLSLTLVIAVSAIMSIPLKNAKIKRELNQVEKEVEKKEAHLKNTLKEYVELREKMDKERSRWADEVAKMDSEIKKLATENDKLEKDNEELKKKVGGRPKKSDKTD